MGRSVVVRYRLGKDGWWVAKALRAARCRAQGRTVDEARRNFREKLGLLIGEDEAEQARRLVKDVMEGALKLEVPLVVEARLGGNWAEVHHVRTSRPP